MVNCDPFQKSHLDHIKRMRARYFATGSELGITGVRPEILECWKLAHESNLSISDTDKPRLSPQSFSLAQERSRQLLEIAVPYMEILNRFLKPDCFWVTLVDDEGIVLKIVGSEQAVALANHTQLYEGSYRGPNVKYTGLFQACRYFNKPFQIVSTEHSSQVDDDLAGAASPIYDLETHQRIGIIGISGYWWETHTHTLGLAIMAAEAISQQFALRRRSKLLQSANQRLDTALEATNLGIVYFSTDGTILAVNRSAMDMLHSTPLSKKDFITRSIFSYLDDTITPERMVDITAEIQQAGEFRCDFVPKQRHQALHSSIRSVSGEQDTYIMQLQRRSEFNKLVADSAISKAVFTFDQIIGTSPPLVSVKETALAAAKYSPAVLILGESGTGKELFAQAIHNASPRFRGPFVPVNCGAIPKALLESELFGYEAGAFTGAQKDGKPGKFELANGGTLFLDEIGDMPYEAQVSLLRAIQSKEIVRIGGKKPIKINITVVAATNQNLEQQIRDRTFREDLYYRLNVFTLRIPPLRERREDIPLLATYFLDKYSRSFDKKLQGISDEALLMLSNYHWPGNVRQLENAIERAIIVSTGDLIQTRDLPQGICQSVNTNESVQQDVLPELRSFVQTIPAFSYADSLRQRMDEADEKLLREMIKSCGGNLSQIARELNISRPTLYRKLKKLGLYEKLHQITL